MTLIPLTQLRRDGGTQPRAGIRSDVVEEYAEALTDGAMFPPVIVFYDGTGYWLADGFHRAIATERVGRTEIVADIRQGTRRDAVLFSTGANATHGQPRTREDKWRAVATLLLDEEWSKWADREIGRKTGTHGTFVAKVRASVTAVNSSERAYTTKHGSIATMNTAAIGISPEEVERRLAEAKAKSEADLRVKDVEAASHRATAAAAQIRQAETARKLVDLEETLKSKAEAASRREANLIADKNELKQRLEEISEEVEKRTWEEADEKYEVILTRFARERDEALKALDHKVRELTGAAQRAHADAAEAAKEMAEAEAARVIETRKKELAEIDEAYRRAQRNCQAAYAQEERAKQELRLTEQMIKEHEAQMARWASSEGELADQVKLAAEVAEFIGTKMADLMMFEYAPHTAAIDKLSKAAGICGQFSQALQSFLSPRVAAQ